MPILEILGVVLNLIFVILLLRQNIWCWAFGIAGSFVSIALFVDAKLYSEAILYSYYVGIGVYGWVRWKGADNTGIPVIVWKSVKHLKAILLGVVLSYGLGYYFSHFTDAKSPFIDATSTIFSFIASYLEAQKVLATWLYWVVLNLVSIGLYYSRGLNFYAGFSAVLTVLSVVGFIQWRKDFLQQKSTDPLFDELN